MSTATLLSRLEGIKQTGLRRWIARCPAHDDHRPSLAIRELDDGRVLVHDFAGCSVQDVLAAVGLTFSDLFPQDLEAPAPGKPRRERRPFSAEDALRCVDFEATLMQVAAADLAAGKALTNEDQARLRLAAERIREARHVVDR
jgi:hypothetical protein